MQDKPDTRASAGTWPVLVLLSLAQFMVILDVSVVNVALPDMARDLALTGAQLTWVVTAYTVCLGGLMVLGGRLADRLGRRRVFLVGLLGFTAASLAAGLATGPTWILAARAAQGIGAALLSPAALAILTATFEGPARHRALTVWGAIGGGGAAVGVLAGGLLTSGPGWTWVFFINVPVGLLVAALTPWLISGGSAQRNSTRLDVFGALLVTGGTAALIYGLVQLGGTGRMSGAVAVGVAALLYVLFGVSQRRLRHPLIDTRLLRQRSVVTGTAVMLVATALLISAFFLNSLLLQGLLGLSPLGTGLVFLPVAVGTVVGAHLAGRLLPRTGPRPVAGTAFGLAAIGLALQSGVGSDASVLTAILPGFTIVAMALGAALVTATTTVLATVDSQVAGTAAGVVNTAHELGAAIGVAAASAVAGIGAAQGLGTVDFGIAFWAGAAVAVLAAGATVVWLPQTLPAGDRPAFVH